MTTWIMTRIPREKATALAGKSERAVLQRSARSLRLVSASRDLDTDEILASCGASGGLPADLRPDLDRAIESLLVRYAEVVVEGPRGGFRIARERRKKVMPGPRLRLPFEVETLRRAYPDLQNWDVLVWQPGMARARFVGLDAVMPSGTATVSVPLLLLRAKRVPGRWVYLSYNAIARCLDGGWDHGSREGWDARRRFRHVVEGGEVQTLGNWPVETMPPLPRRPSLRRMQSRLSKDFGAVLIVDGAHTGQEPRIVTGAAAARLSPLAALYGEPFGRRDMVIVVQSGVRSPKQHVTMLAEQAGMLVAMKESLA